MSDEYSKIISENLDKSEQIRLTVSEFRGIEYLHFRKYFQSFEGDWLPTDIGVTIEANFNNVSNVLLGLYDILAKAEVRQILGENND